MVALKIFPLDNDQIITKVIFKFILSLLCALVYLSGPLELNNCFLVQVEMILQALEYEDGKVLHICSGN